MFVFLDGLKQTRILVNTKAIETVKKTKIDENFLIVIGMTSGEKIKLYYEDKNNRDMDFGEFTDYLCYHSTDDINRFVMSYYKYVGRNDIHVRVKGENYDAVEVTNAHSNDNSRLSFNITNK